MEFSFYKYFLNYIFHSKTRQKLLFLAGIGLFLSSLSLVIIQGIMGGLQKGLISRSKSVLGSGVVKVLNQESLPQLTTWLDKRKILYTQELTLEMLAKRGQFVTPVKIVGIDEKKYLPDYLQKKDLTGAVVSSEVSYKLKTALFSEIELISPSHTLDFMGEVPRISTSTITDYLMTDVSEVDEFYIFTRIAFLQNLIGEIKINSIRIFNETNLSDLKSFLQTNKDFKLLTWEEMNSTLVWALSLETGVMILLFSAMSFLVAIATTAGLLLFYDKIKIDLLSFWLLGLSKKNIFSFIFRFTQIYALVACSFGIALGIVVLKVLERYGHQFMPDIFVEQSFPIFYSFSTIGVALAVPYFICLVFSYFSFDFFRKENTDYLALIRSLHS
jgi:lipoprotein-releasing system permease protein